MDIRHTATMPWQNGLDVVANMAPAFGDNLGPAGEVAKVYVKYNQKTLVIDPQTTFRGDLVDIEAGYADLTDAYHDSVEECLFLTGDCTLNGEGEFFAGDYFWRPPGFVHSASTREGFTGLLFLTGRDESEHSGPTSRNIRPGEEAGTNAIDDDLESAVGPRGWVRRISTKYLAWTPGKYYARTQGDLSGLDLEHLAVKVLSHNPRAGGQSLLVRLAPGFRQTASVGTDANVGFYVIEGAAEIGGEALLPGSWVWSPSGEALEGLSSADGAELFFKSNGFLGAPVDP